MYQALYRKYRPHDFKSVVGQDAIVKTLKNSIINHNFTHAYMFYGPRGTGKTTISKIFARSINCLNNKDGEACGKCESCKSSFYKECIDIIEIDAASNNGVDEIRELKNKINLVPNELKYKVYIIDEVHMLSLGAFNALLKTLEEPPEHAIFILATTDPQKVPETVISRCQCFSFKRISNEVIKKQLEMICKKEKIDIEKSVLTNISEMSNGGLRDALGMLDKMISYTNEKITMSDFEEVNDIVSKEEIENLLSDIFDAKIDEVLRKIDLFDKNGKNLTQIVNQLLNYSRNAIVDYYLNKSQIPFSINTLQEFTNILNEKIIDIRKSASSKIYIEMLLLKFINDYILTNSNNKTTNVVQNTENVDKKENIRVKIEEKEAGKQSNDDITAPKNNKGKTNISNDSKKILNLDEIITVRINNVLAKANKKYKIEEEEKFKILNDYTFDNKIGYLVCALLDSKICVASDEIVLISYEYDNAVEQNLIQIEKLTDVYNKLTNSNKKLAIISDSKWSKVKDEYIINLKNNYKYEIKDEPTMIFEESPNNDIINNAMDLFGDIVEVE